MNLSKNKSKRILFYSSFIILLDQLSKFFILKTLGFENSKNIIPKVLNFTLVKNKGAAFSLFSDSTTSLTIISATVSLILIYFIVKSPPKSNLNSLGLAYLLGGTTGNGVDRLFKGFVLDFIDFIPIDFPIFNIADIAINIAILCFMIDIIKQREANHNYFF